MFGSRALLVWSILLTPVWAVDPLPRFTEEREAAAQHFVRKHCAELVPVLDELARTSRPQYERQIREIFQVTELLAELRDDPRRYELELKIWKAENRAFLLVARLAGSRASDRKPIEDSLQDLSRELVELDIQHLEMQTSTLEAELLSARTELNRMRDNLERSTRERYDLLLDQAKKRKKGN